MQKRRQFTNNFLSASISGNIKCNYCWDSSGGGHEHKADERFYVHGVMWKLSIFLLRFEKLNLKDFAIEKNFGLQNIALTVERRSFDERWHCGKLKEIWYRIDLLKSGVEVCLINCHWMELKLRFFFNYIKFLQVISQNMFFSTFVKPQFLFIMLNNVFNFLQPLATFSRA